MAGPSADHSAIQIRSNFRYKTKCDWQSRREREGCMRQVRVQQRRYILFERWQLFERFDNYRTRLFRLFMVVRGDSRQTPIELKLHLQQTARQSELSNGDRIIVILSQPRLGKIKYAARRFEDVANRAQRRQDEQNETIYRGVRHLSKGV